MCWQVVTSRALNHSDIYKNKASHLTFLTVKAWSMVKKQNISTHKIRQRNMLSGCDITGPKGLVTNYGEGWATKREGGHVKFYPYEKGEGGGAKVLAMLKRGHKKFWCSFYVVA